MVRITISIGIAMLASAILSFAHSSAQYTGIRVVGITDRSSYTEFVKARWYPENAKATLKKNAKKPVPFENGSKISENGRCGLMAFFV